MIRIPRVAITGVGPVSPLGIGKKEFWNGLLVKKPTLAEIKYKIDNELWFTFLKHKIENFNIFDFEINEQQLLSLNEWKEGIIDEDLYFMLAAVSLALRDSNLELERERKTIGLIVTHENPGLEQYFSQILEATYKYFQVRSNKISKVDFYNSIFKSMLKSSYELQTFMPVFHIAKVFGLHGYSLFINNACASGAFALEEAKKIICSGQSKAVIVVTADIPNVYKYLWFMKLGIYSKNGEMKPFCKDADGFLMGDGAVALVLEDMEYARRRSAHIYGEYMGGSFCQEAWKVTLPAVAERYYKNIILTVLKNMKISPAKIDLIVPHGVATPLSDKYEAETLDEIFGGLASKPYLHPLKTYFGHNLGGNVLLEIAAILMMIENKCIIPITYSENEKFITKLSIPNKTIKKEIKYVLKTTCAFAGFDSAIIIKN